MKELEFPFDSRYIMRHRRGIKKQLLADGSERIKVRIAVLGGSTTNDIVSAMELFLLDSGIEPAFWQSEYNRFYEDAVFGNESLESFRPDVIYIHTTSCNLKYLPDDPNETEDDIKQRLEMQTSILKQVWTSLAKNFGVPIIQNNFELPLYRHTGSYDRWGITGRSAFIDRMNLAVSEYARNCHGFYVNDINYLSAAVGLEKWHDPDSWFLYKYAMNIDVIPDLAYSTVCIIRSLYGKNKKAVALDLDNTLWGGVVGDDGQEGIEIGEETAEGESYSMLQNWLRAYKKYGILLTVCSKNDAENALLGLEHPSGILRPDDFASIKANWQPKSENIEASAAELGLLPESFIFVDDNPAECDIVSSQLPSVRTIEASSVKDTLYRLSRSSWFEVTDLSGDDLVRNEMYAANAKRQAMQKQFTNYTDYLLSLDMHAEIADFTPVFLPRITQLTNKSNQFNLTTRRYTSKEMEDISRSSDRIRLCGSLTDKFGDNGIVSVIIGRCEKETLHVELWLMSCRVLKRDMEYAMLDELVHQCIRRGISRIMGYYYKTEKNSMVAELYGDLGFTLLNKSENGSSVWNLDLDTYENKNKVIKVNEKEKIYE
ncbi:MAG TPA: HAD-IIIC family phosphatase [Ruminococcus flavefaciens]|nr:HAD-IIIC family phosphatase [Ruminococcus flavefaciens]